MSHTIEVLHTADCPRWPVAVERAHEAVSLLGLQGTVEVHEVLVETDDEAKAIGFAGSPTVRVNGKDVELGAPAGDEPSLRCRLYRPGGIPDPAPPVEWIRNALLSADR